MTGWGNGFGTGQYRRNGRRCRFVDYEMWEGGGVRGLCNGCGNVYVGKDEEKDRRAGQDGIRA